MNTDGTISMGDRVIQQLETTKKEIEQFIYELSLENTNAQARYEELKDQLRTSVRDMRQMLNSKDLLSEEVAAALLVKLSVIDEHLRKPGRDTIDHIKRFVTGIRGALKEVTEAFGKDGAVNEFLENAHDQFQRYKLKFEILKLRLALGKLKVTYAGEEMRQALAQKLKALSKFVHEGHYETEEKLNKLRHTVKRIYADISKIFLD